METIKGLHHVTNVTRDAQANHDFYTKVMGMRLLKKTVNQDDVSAYHTFFGDEMSSAGNDITFFDFGQARPTVRGTNAVTSVGLRVPSDAALDYWIERFNTHGVKHEGIDTRFGVKGIRFEDPDGLRLRLVSDETGGGYPGGVPNTFSDVPYEFAIIGLGTVELTVRHAKIQDNFLTKTLEFKEVGSEDGWVRYETGPGGNSSSIHVLEEQRLQNEIPGYGSVHHIALRVQDEDEINEMITQVRRYGLPNSGFVNRHYFKSLYTRVGTILYEFATDASEHELGFLIDESIDELGETLSLPPFLEPRRDVIEKNIKPLNTKRINYKEV